MKMSEYLRRYQITGAVPDSEGDGGLALWAGFLLGGQSMAINWDQRREMAIKCAEFIEERARHG